MGAGAGCGRPDSRRSVRRSPDRSYETAPSQVAAAAWPTVRMSGWGCPNGHPWDHVSLSQAASVEIFPGHGPAGLPSGSRPNRNRSWWPSCSQKRSNMPAPAQRGGLLLRAPPSAACARGRPRRPGCRERHGRPGHGAAARRPAPPRPLSAAFPPGRPRRAGCRERHGAAARSASAAACFSAPAARRLSSSLATAAVNRRPGHGAAAR